MDSAVFADLALDLVDVVPGPLVLLDLAGRRRHQVRVGGGQRDGGGVHRRRGEAGRRGERRVVGGAGGPLGGRVRGRPRRSHTCEQGHDCENSNMVLS